MVKPLIHPDISVSPCHRVTVMYDHPRKGHYCPQKNNKRIIKNRKHIRNKVYTHIIIKKTNYVIRE